MRLLSPRELAEALGVSESSLKRWVDAGKINAARTEGGHRRIALPEAVRFIRESGAPLAHPELLDMPEVAAVQQLPAAARGTDAFRHYLAEGDAASARGWLLSRYLAGSSVAELCDGPVREAMVRIGDLWEHDPEGVFIEHRATDTCLQALSHLRSTFEPLPRAPLALGATPEGDPYLLPTFMAAMVVASVGMRAVNLGPDTPVSALESAYLHHVAAGSQPALVWLSASAHLAPERAHELESWLGGLPAATVVVVGGRNGYEIANKHIRIRTTETMTDLAAIAAGVLRPVAT
ncbi:excisionase family DNA-binding protein [soil metagenome]